MDWTSGINEVEIWCWSTYNIYPGETGVDIIYFSTTGPLCKGDFDGDGDVEGSDLAAFVVDFGRIDCPLSPET